MKKKLTHALLFFQMSKPIKPFRSERRMKGEREQRERREREKKGQNERKKIEERQFGANFIVRPKRIDWKRRERERDRSK